MSAQTVSMQTPDLMLSSSSVSPSNGSEDSIQIVDGSGNVGQVMKIQDGTFMIVDCKNQPVEDKSLVDESPDAVQTLIDAVQELIQTHEACKEEEDEGVKKEPDQRLNGVKEVVQMKTGGCVEQVGEGEREDDIHGGRAVVVMGGDGGGISEEVWSSL